MGDMAELYAWWDYLSEGDHTSSKYCPLCDGLLLTKTGKYGKFKGCIQYPECYYTEDLL